MVPILITASCAFGQTYTIRTLAGGALPQNLPATSARLGGVTGVAVDAAGNIFMVLPDYNIVLRRDAATGFLTRVAGNGTLGFSGENGPATSAQLYLADRGDVSTVGPHIAVDGAGSLYFADTFNHRIRKVSSGVITTVAGNGEPGFSGDNGPATRAQLFNPWSVAIDAAGNLYIADLGNDVVRKVSNGLITTVAGNGAGGFSGDNGPATSARLSGPRGVTLDTSANLYIADYGNGRIRKVSNGVIVTVAGGGSDSSLQNGPATSAQIQPNAVTVDAVGSLYIADANRLRRVSNGVITTLAGTTAGFSGDNGPATSAQLWAPSGVALDGAGNVYIADTINERIRKITGGVITTVAGGGSSPGDNEAPTNAQFYYPHGVAVNSSGRLYIADSRNNRIRQISSGVITTIAGTGVAGIGGDNGPALNAQLGYDCCIALDSTGSLYLSEFTRVRKVADGVITTVAGTATSGFGGDNGPATSAQLNGASGIALDSAGNLYIADAFNNRIRKVSNGIITTVAGTGIEGFSGDGGQAIRAQLREPSGVAVDAAGNLYIADTNNHRVRRVSGGVITTLAGTTAGFSGDTGPSTSAQLWAPSAIAVDAAGNVYIGDTYNQRIRKVSNGTITTVAGSGTRGFSGDNGSATGAQLGLIGSNTRPFSGNAIAVDPSGTVYIVDSGNHRIRVLEPTTNSCTFLVNPSTVQAATTGGSLTVSVQTDRSCSWNISGLPSWIIVTGSTSGTGPATITLVVAANAGNARTAAISIGGAQVSVTQQGSTSCTYAISPRGQAWPASGGSGTISLVTDAICGWSVSSSQTWVAVEGATTGTGSARLNYLIATNTGGARAATVTIAGLAFTVEQASASIAGFANRGSMTHLASAGYWKTTITLVNTGSAEAQARLNFFDDNGSPLVLPLTFPQSSSSSGPLLASTLDRSLSAGAALVIESTGPDDSPTLVGSAQLLTNATVSGFAIFRQRIGGSQQEAVVPLEDRNAGSYVLYHDNTSGFATGVALANTSTQAALVAVTVRDDSGAIVLSNTITIPAQGHTSFNLVDRYPSTAQKRGTIEFRTAASGQVSALGLRFNPAGAFSTIPVLTK